MGHSGEIGGHDAAVDVLAHGQREPRFCLGEGFRLDHVAQMDRLAVVVGHLNADMAGAGHAFDQDALSAHRQAEIVTEAGHAAVLHARVWLELVGRDHGAGIDLNDLPVHLELSTFFDQFAGFVPQHIFANCERFLALVQQGAGRQLESADVFGSDGGCAQVGIGALVDRQALRCGWWLRGR